MPAAAALGEVVLMRLRAENDPSRRRQPAHRDLPASIRRGTPHAVHQPRTSLLPGRTDGTPSMSRAVSLASTMRPARVQVDDAATGRHRAVAHGKRLGRWHRRAPAARARTAGRAAGGSRSVSIWGDPQPLVATGSEIPQTMREPLRPVQPHGQAPLGTRFGAGPRCTPATSSAPVRYRGRGGEPVGLRATP